MKDKQLDDLIRKNLEEIQPEYNAGTWAELSEKMDQRDMADVELDSHVKNEMEDMNVPYSDSNWLRLQNWLDFRWMALSKLYVSKFSELALMVLAVFTLFNYQSKHSQEEKPYALQLMDDSGEAQAISKDVIASLEMGHNIQTVEDKEPKVASHKEMNLREAILAGSQDEKTTKPSSNLIASAAVVSTDRSTENVFLNPAMDGNQSAITTAQRGYEQNESNGIRQANTASGSQAEVDVSEYKEIEPLDQRALSVFNATLDAVDLLAALTPSILDQFSDDYKTGLVNIYEQASKIKLKKIVDKAFYIRPTMALDFNQITTPYDELFDNSGYAQQKVGIGGGLMLGKKVGDISMETGFIYSSKKYSPKEFIEIFIPENSEENKYYSFDKIHLNTLTIPLQLNYEFDRDGRWTSFVSTGAAMHLALQANYETRELPYPRFAPVPDNANVTRGQSPRFDEKKFADGLFEGGNFKENHYFTLNLGAGIEYALSKNLSVYAQPTFYYNIFNNGLGPNNDKIHTLSLNMGSKIKFGR
jgi:hypothetical protein